MAAVTICSDFGAPQNEVSHCFHCFPIYLPWSEGTRYHEYDVNCRFFVDGLIVLRKLPSVPNLSVFNMLSRLVIAFLPRSKHLLISWLQSPSAVILELPKIKFLTVSNVSPSLCHKVMGLDAMILVFWMLSFKPTFHSPLSLSSRGSLVLLHFLP